MPILAPVSFSSVSRSAMLSAKVPLRGRTSATQFCAPFQ